MKPYRMLFLIVTALIALQFVSHSSLYAAAHATFTVNTTKDTLDKKPGDGICADKKGKCSLRAAIMEANALGGKNTIVLKQGTYSLSIAGRGEDNAKKGDLDIRGNIRVRGAGMDKTILDGALLDRVFEIHKGKVTVQDLQITRGLENTPSASGGGILAHEQAKLTLNRVYLLANQANYQGGGLANRGDAVVLASRFDANSSGAQGGGISNGVGTLTIDQTSITNHSAGGGVNSASGGTVKITNSVISGNQGGGLSISGTGIVTNSTISLNTSSYGGGVVLYGGSLYLQNVTVAYNSATINYGGLRMNLGTSATVRNSIIAKNVVGATPSDCSGVFNSQDYNILGAVTADCTYNSMGHDIVSNPASPIDPKLDPNLADNGGPTYTHALLSGSPAIDAANPAGCTDNASAQLTTDQRGSARPTDGDGMNGARCDIGAFEK